MSFPPPTPQLSLANTTLSLLQATKRWVESENDEYELIILGFSQLNVWKVETCRVLWETSRKGTEMKTVYQYCSVF